MFPTGGGAFFTRSLDPLFFPQKQHPAASPSATTARVRPTATAVTTLMCRVGGALELLAGPTGVPSLGILDVSTCCAGTTEAGFGGIGVRDS